MGSFEETSATITPQPAQRIGPLVEAHHAKRPERITLQGRWITLAPLDAEKHAAALYEGSNGDEVRDSVWTYLFNGPFANPDDFAADLELKARSVDPHFFAVVDNASGRAVGYQALMRIDPTNRVIEVGNILYTPAMQRTRGATEAQYLFARYVFDALGNRRYEWKCNALNAPVEARRRALRLHVRGRVPPAHDRQGPQPRHRLVRDARRGVAGPQGRLRALALVRQFRRPGPPEGEPVHPHAQGRTMTPTIAEKRRRFAELHSTPGCFVMPNPYDVGSAKYLASLGFPAIATSSAGMAFAAGLPDGGVTRDYALKHIRDLAAAVDCPLNADFEAGFAPDVEGVYESARLCIGAGVAGFSIEDFSGAREAPLYTLNEAVERVRAARAAIDASGETVLLTARSEAIWRENAGGLLEALRRLAAYAEAGADFLPPGVKTAQEVAEVVRVAGKLPVNVVVGAPGLTRRQLEDLGVKRISTGAALARAAWGALIGAAREIAENGRFDAFAGLPSSRDIEAALADRS